MLGVTTPPRAGVFCQAACVGYPYTDVAAFVPRDYWWMYPGLLGALLFAALALCLHPVVAPARRLPAAIGTGAAVIGATALVLDYAVQLMVMQPALQAGETDGLSPWSQYDPHGMFIALENLGYALFGAAFVLLGTALATLPGGGGEGGTCDARRWRRADPRGAGGVGSGVRRPAGRALRSGGAGAVLAGAHRRRGAAHAGVRHSRRRTAPAHGGGVSRLPDPAGRLLSTLWPSLLIAYLCWAVGRRSCRRPCCAQSRACRPRPPRPC